MLRNKNVTAQSRVVSKMIRIKIDKKSLENKCVSSVIRIMHDTHFIKKYL